MKKTCVVVTGGCGYIGSHVVCQLSEAGYEVVVIDNLSTGFADSLLYGEKLYIGNVGDAALLAKVLTQHAPKAVLHFAASIAVEESVYHPLAYYQNNTATFLTLLQQIELHGISRCIFSSTAAVYGNSDAPTLRETDSLSPENPYGRSKWMDELFLKDLGAAYPLQYVILRYFNVAGADRKLRLGQRTQKATHLIKVASEVATGKRKSLVVYGDDYPTRDGTCVRDYIHVEDLAAAHLAALSYLEKGGASEIFNCGCNRGASVREVVSAFDEILGRPLPFEMGKRRAGDAASLIANAEKITAQLGWKPQYQDLSEIVRSAWAWEMKITALASKDPHT